MYGFSFWKDALERAIKTAAQVVGAAYTVGEGFNAFTVDWQSAWQLALSGAVYSLLMSVASSPIRANGTASIIK